MPKRIQPSKIILVGDFTTAVFGGWGPSFCADHVTAFAVCLNVARGGRSSRTYIQEPGTSPCVRLRQKAISMSGG
jgi:lysophospholipase L1-like esterase